jgi:uncharacterized membrane protein YfcA
MLASITGETVLLILALLGAGIVSGFFAGFFGVGGGGPVVFALYETFRIVGVPAEVRMHMSVGTALAVMIAGSFVAAMANQIALKFVFAILVAFTGVKMLSSRMTWRLPNDIPSTPATWVAGLLTGLFSSLMGIGGGVFGNMFLSLYGRSMHQIIGTSASLGVLIAVPGMIGYMAAGLPFSDLTPPGSIGYVSLLATLIVAPIAAVTAPLGVYVAHRFTSAQLKRAFGIFLLVLSARFWLSILTGI